MKKIFIIIAVMLVVKINAATVFVTTADDANAAMKAAEAGDKIIFKDGTYTDAVLNFSNINGTEQNPVTLTAEHTGKVFFEGNSTLSFSGNYVVVDGFTWQNGGKDLGTKSVIEFKASKIEATHCTLQNCAIIGYNNSNLGADNKWVSVYGTYNSVDHCLLKDKFNLGATLVVWLDGTTQAHHTITNNYFLNRQNGPGEGNGLESIRCGDSKTSMTPAHCVFAFNRFEDCDGETEIISNKSCFNSYLHNTIYNSSGGLTLRHGNSCVVDGNVFDGNGKDKTYGVRVIGEDHVVVNNYFYNLQGSSDKWRAPLGLINGRPNTPLNGYFQVKRAMIAYNIFVNNKGPYIRTGAGKDDSTVPPDSITITGNFLYNDTNKDAVAYESITSVVETHFSIYDNIVVGKNLQANKGGFNKVKYKSTTRNGFDFIKDDKGNELTSVKDKKLLKSTSGANMIPDWIAQKIADKKYSYITKEQVGPVL